MLSQFKKSKQRISQISEFSTLADCTRPKDHSFVELTVFQVQFVIGSRQSDFLTIFSRFLVLSVLQNPLSKSKIRKFVIFVAFIILILRAHVLCEMFQLHFMLEKRRPDVLTLWHSMISRSLAICFQKTKCANWE